MIIGLDLFVDLNGCLSTHVRQFYILKIPNLNGEQNWGSKSQKNIARGTTDPEIDSVTWTKFSDHKAWSADGATCISSKFGHQMAKLALVINLATR